MKKMRMKRRKQRKEIDVSYITEIYEKRKARRQIASVPVGLGILDSSSVLSEQSIIPFFFSSDYIIDVLSGLQEGP